MTARIISFAVTGAWASFRDPSVTSNQLVYYIPSKTAVIGMLGAMIGTKRDGLLDRAYSEAYLDLFAKTQIGIRIENNPQKVVCFTNHRSLKEPKTKPTKKEMLESPEYRMFVKSTDEVLSSLSYAIENSRFVFSPYLGHAYCQAKITDLCKYENVEKVNSAIGKNTNCVVLDETDPSHNENSHTYLKPIRDEGTIMIERHLHHFVENESLQSRVFKHWIPLKSTVCEIEEREKSDLSEFYRVKENDKDKEMVYCLY